MYIEFYIRTLILLYQCEILKYTHTSYEIYICCFSTPLTLSHLPITLAIHFTNDVMCKTPFYAPTIIIITTLLLPIIWLTCETSFDLFVPNTNYPHPCTAGHHSLSQGHLLLSFITHYNRYLSLLSLMTPFFSLNPSTYSGWSSTITPNTLFKWQPIHFVK